MVLISVALGGRLGHVLIVFPIVRFPAPSHLGLRRIGEARILLPAGTHAVDAFAPTAWTSCLNQLDGRCCRREEGGGTPESPAMCLERGYGVRMAKLFSPLKLVLRRPTRPRNGPLIVCGVRGPSPRKPIHSCVSLARDAYCYARLPWRSARAGHCDSQEKRTSRRGGRNAGGQLFRDADATHQSLFPFHPLEEASMVAVNLRRNPGTTSNELAHARRRGGWESHCLQFSPRTDAGASAAWCVIGLLCPVTCGRKARMYVVFSLHGRRQTPFPTQRLRFCESGGVPSQTAGDDASVGREASSTSTPL